MFKVHAIDAGNRDLYSDAIEQQLVMMRRGASTTG
jgi:hypothetical protein